ncbi:MAG: hypothetical protein WAT51_04655 [Holophaga sp.]
MVLRSLFLAPMVSVLGMAQTVDFGVQAQLTLPGGDLKQRTEGTSVGLGSQVRWNLSRGHAVVAKADYTAFNGHRSVYGPYGYVEETTREALISLGADYNYYLSRQVGQGFYVGGGLGALHMRVHAIPSHSFLFRDDTDQTKTRLYFDLNLGMALNRRVNVFLRTLVFGDELQGSSSNGNSGETRSSYSLSTTFALGAEFHF